MEIEVICSDSREHGARLETRKPDISGLRLPSWEQVISREYHPWDREHIVIDTANRKSRTEHRIPAQPFCWQRATAISVGLNPSVRPARCFVFAFRVLGCWVHSLAVLKYSILPKRLSAAVPTSPTRAMFPAEPHLRDGRSRGFDYRPPCAFAKSQLGYLQQQEGDLVSRLP
jgi:hypothetical protein